MVRQHALRQIVLLSQTANVFSKRNMQRFSSDDKHDMDARGASSGDAPPLLSRLFQRMLTARDTDVR
jgi:hypothetical protein